MSNESVPSSATATPAPTAKVLRKLFLTLFLRGRSSRGLKKDTAPKSVGRKLAFTLLFYILFGGLAVMFIGKPVFVLSFYLHGMTLGFLGLFVASSTGEILFNKDEPDILLHRPVDAAELLWAKVSVLILVSLWLAGGFNLAGTITGIYASNGGWMYPAVHLASTALEAMFCTSLVVVVFQLCLRWLGREKLDGLMTTAQVIMAVMVVMAGQIVPRMMGTMMMDLDKLTSAWWMMLLPPAWFAGFDDALAAHGGVHSWIMAAIGLVVTGFLTWLAFGRLAGDYEAGLQLMNQSRTFTAKSRSRRKFVDRLAHVPPLSWWLRDSVARASFLLVIAYLLRDRDVKLRVYPGIAPMLVLPVIFLLPGHGIGGNDNTFGIIFGACYLSLIPAITLGLLQYSDQWQASDLFRIAPIVGPAQISHGARRAVIFLLTAPLVLVFAVAVVLITGHVSSLLLILPGVIAAPVYSLVPGLAGKAVPLSQPMESAKGAGRGLYFLLLTMICFALTGAAWFCWRYHWYGWFLAGEVTLALCAYVILRAATFSARWEPL
jgi:hypothetical protein